MRRVRTCHALSCGAERACPSARAREPARRARPDGRRPSRLCAAVAVATLAACPAAVSEDRVAFVTGGDYEPYADPDLPGGGMIPAIVRAAYAKIPTKLTTIDFTAWRRGYRAVKTGKYTGTFPYIRTDKREREMYFSDPIYTVTIRPVMHRDNDTAINEIADLHGLTYCTPEDYSPTETVKALENAGKVEAVRPYRMIDCARMLKQDRVDFIPIQKPVIVAAAKKAFGTTKPLRFPDFVLERNTLHAIFARPVTGSKSARDTFNTALAKLRASGAWADIVERYRR